jgi:hypothetical protein
LKLSSQTVFEVTVVMAQVRFVPRAERSNAPEVSQIPMGIAWPGYGKSACCSLDEAPHFTLSCAVFHLSFRLLAELDCKAIGDGSLDARDVRFPSFVARKSRIIQSWF